MSVAAWAQQALAASDAATRLPLFTQMDRDFDLVQAYAVAHAVRESRIGRAHHPSGYKIGFTNRTLWPKYGVHAPIWGVVWDTTLRLLAGGRAEVSLAGLVQPRLEPEIVFGFGAEPRRGMSENELLACIDWVAHGVEIVHTHFDGWRFQAADAVADGALHGRLLVGPTVPLARFEAPGQALEALELQLWCDGVVVDRGSGAVVLDGPLAAVRVWLDAMLAQPHGWCVGAGDVVTTGTLTDAWPLAVGQEWRTVVSDVRLSGLQLHIVP
jgi:2-oxo-3-hexenedioate decarboxylase